MTHAFRCDWCEEFHEGDPTVSLELQITVQPNSLLESVFDVRSDVNPSETLDFCSIDCLQEFPLGAKRDELLAEVGEKDELLAGGEQT